MVSVCMHNLCFAGKDFSFFSCLKTQTKTGCPCSLLALLQSWMTAHKMKANTPNWPQLAILHPFCYLLTNTGPAVSSVKQKH